MTTKARARDYETEEREATLRMVQDPKTWPQWPRLPLKNRGEKQEDGWPLLGLLVDHRRSPTDPFRVYLGLLFTADVTKLPHRDYPDAAALVAAGWVVD